MGGFECFWNWGSFRRIRGSFVAAPYSLYSGFHDDDFRVLLGPGCRV